MGRRGDQCQLETAVRVIGGACKVLVLYELLRGVTRFNALERALPAITPTTLSRTLKGLERDGILTKTTFPGNLPRTEYALTKVGRSLEPIVEALEKWGRTYLSEAPARKLPGG